MNPYALAWRQAQVLGWRSRTVWWSAFYGVWLRLHPAVKRIGRLKVTGPVTWLLDPGAIVEIGDGVVINSGFWHNAVAGQVRSLFHVRAGGILRLNDRCGLSSVTIACTDRIEIEAEVMIGGGSVVFDSDFHSIRLAERRMDPDPGVKHKPIRICAGAFIGAYSVIARGVTIGERAVVGAGSVVYFSIPPDTIWAGNPAQMIGVVPKDG
jgi:acetyltransferase-like isoleucine patch superfamily enzyme